MENPGTEKEPRRKKMSADSVTAIVTDIAGIFDDTVGAKKLIQKTINLIWADTSGRFRDVKRNLGDYLHGFLVQQMELALLRGKHETGNPVSLLEFHLEEWLIRIKDRAGDQEIAAAREGFKKKLKKLSGERSEIAAVTAETRPQPFEATLDELKIPEVFEEFVAREEETNPDHEEEV